MIDREEPGLLHYCSLLLMLVNSTMALEAFIRRNKLPHVIRAHEVKATGFQVTMHGVRGGESCGGMRGGLGWDEGRVGVGRGEGRVEGRAGLGLGESSMGWGL